jgi:hypothetical protein
LEQSSPLPPSKGGDEKMEIILKKNDNLNSPFGEGYRGEDKS